MQPRTDVDHHGGVLIDPVCWRAWRTAFVSASRPAVPIIASLGLATLVMGLVTTGCWARGTTRRVAHLFGDEAPENFAALSIGGRPAKVEW